MALGTYSGQAKPVGGGAVPSNAAIFDLNDNERIAYMKSMGAKNVDPPLVRSSHVKNVKTGLVLPWNEMLAEQRDILVNCDAYGNTDPSAWLPTVEIGEISEDERMELLHARSLNIAQGNNMASGFRDETMVDPNQPQQQGYPAGVTAIGDTSAADIVSQEAFDALLARLDS